MLLAPSSLHTSAALLQKCATPTPAVSWGVGPSRSGRAATHPSLDSSFRLIVTTTASADSPDAASTRESCATVSPSSEANLEAYAKTRAACSMPQRERHSHRCSLPTLALAFWG